MAKVKTISTEELQLRLVFRLSAIEKVAAVRVL